MWEMKGSGFGSCLLSKAVLCKELATNKLHIPRGLTVSKALASTTPTTLIARHTYCPWSLVEARTTLKVPDGSKIWRSSEGSLPPFLVQAISGTG